MSITHADNFQLLFDGNGPEWIPFSLYIGAIDSFTEPVMEKFAGETGSRKPEEYFDYDYRCFSLTSRFGGDNPRSLHPGLEPEITFDEWSIGHGTGGAEGSCDRLYPPLAHTQCINDVEALPVPQIEKSTDFTAIEEYKTIGYPVFGYAGSVYEWSWWLRGMEQFMADMLLAPALAGAIIEKVAAHTLNLAQSSAGAGIDVLCFYDDAGMQTGMQISPELWRKFIKPVWSRILEAVRAKFPLVKFFLHCCGNIREIVPDIVEAGFDILHPIQPECMDLEEVKAEFGNEIVLCATLSSQKTLPFGTPDEVREEVRRLRKLFKDDNRCILCPSNRIQPETPWENVVAFVEESSANRKL